MQAILPTSKQIWDIWDDPESQRRMAVRHLGIGGVTGVSGIDTPEMTKIYLNKLMWDTWKDTEPAQKEAVGHLWWCKVTPVSYSEI